MARSPRTDAKFRRIYDGYLVAIPSYCLRRLPTSDANDAVAEAFLVVWRRIDDVPDGDEASLWLYGIAHNVVRNVDRAARRRSPAITEVDLLFDASGDASSEAVGGQATLVGPHNGERCDQGEHEESGGERGHRRSNRGINHWRQESTPYKADEADR